MIYDKYNILENDNLADCPKECKEEIKAYIKSPELGLKEETKNKILEIFDKMASDTMPYDEILKELGLRLLPQKDIVKVYVLVRRLDFIFVDLKAGVNIAGICEEVDGKINQHVHGFLLPMCTMFLSDIDKNIPVWLELVAESAIRAGIDIENLEKNREILMEDYANNPLNYLTQEQFDYLNSRLNEIA